MNNRDVILGITGASGAIFSVRLLHVLLVAGRNVHLSISGSGKEVLNHELDLSVKLDDFQLESMFRPKNSQGDAARLLGDVFRIDDAQSLIELPTTGNVLYHHHSDFMAPMASGSFLSGGMVICPCSGTTMSAIAHASSSNLIQRAAEVQLKERRPLVVVPRETPVSTIQLENMQRVSQAGAVVLPATPGWYHGVQSVADLVDFVVARICDQLEIENTLTHRWGT